MARKSLRMCPWVPQPKPTDAFITPQEVSPLLGCLAIPALLAEGAIRNTGRHSIIVLSNDSCLAYTTRKGVPDVKVPNRRHGRVCCLQPCPPEVSRRCI